ncbi:MAG: hypothetical protein KJ709_08220 [Nanoarchaeota archaeon]|nr:hypothetical protein [Nanoarchaeota archaeon]
MGFGYNPSLVTSGERLDMLQFFAGMKRLTPVNEWCVWDASGYYIINKVPRKKIIKLGDKPKASDLIEVFINEQDRPKRWEIRENCDLRSSYLQKMLVIAEVEGLYIDSREIFRSQDTGFIDAFSESLEFTSWLRQEKPELYSKVTVSNPNPASSYYLPLELAETIYLQETFGITGKFGPKTEEFFDECIMIQQIGREKRYDFAWVPVPPEGIPVPYLGSSARCIRTFNDEASIRDKLKDKEYREYVGSFMGRFWLDGETLEDCVCWMLDLLNEEGLVEKINQPCGPKTRR